MFYVKMGQFPFFSFRIPRVELPFFLNCNWLLIKTFELLSQIAIMAENTSIISFSSDDLHFMLHVFNFVERLGIE